MSELAVSAAELQELLEGTAFTRRLGVRVESLEDGVCTLLVPFQPVFERPGGIVAGEIYMSSADVAFWCATKTRLGLADGSTTTNLETAFLAPARQEPILCRARVLKWGRRLVYGDAECRSVESGKLLTHHTLTYMRFG